MEYAFQYNSVPVQNQYKLGGLYQKGHPFYKEIGIIKEETLASQIYW